MSDMSITKPNILFLVLDSFRADKCFGKDKTSISPNIDSLIANGVYFKQNISSAFSTLLSTSSIMTGFYPFQALRSDRKNLKMLSNTVTYIGLLRDFGYHTHAAIPNAIDFWGLGKHFENKYVPSFKELILSKGLGHKIIEQLQSKKMQEPWILYVHAMDLHELGDLPEEFNDSNFGFNQYDRMMSSVDAWIGKILQQVDLEKTIVVLTGDHGSDEGAYTPSMKFVNYNKKPLDFDNNVYRLVSNTFWFKSDLSPKLRFVRNIIGKCLRVPQSILTQIRFMQINRQKIPLHQKRILKHAIADVEEIYDGLIRVPLVFSGNGIPRGIIIDKQTRLIDVFPTIADLVNLPKRKDKIHGRSLLPYFQGKVLDELPARIESTPKWFAPVSKDQLGIRTSEYKYFRNRNNPTKDVCLYDLKNDPFEEKNIANQNPAIVQRMEHLLSEVDTDSVLENDFEDMDEETKGKIESELKKLGYI